MPCKVLDLILSTNNLHFSAGDQRIASTYVVAKGGRAPMKPTLLLDRKFYTPGYQGDAHEFLVKVLDSNISLGTRIVDLMRGEDAPQLRCPDCGHARLAAGKERFWSLALPIFTVSGKTLHSSQSVMDAFLEHEDLGSDFNFQCSDICAYRSKRPQKQHAFSVMPPVLCLCLKRTGANGHIYDHKVTPSRQLRVQSVLYNLCSIVVHRGAENNGHYWAVCKHLVNKQNTWWVYNDGIRKQAKPSDFDNPEDRHGIGRISVLFYEAHRRQPQVLHADTASSSDFLSTTTSSAPATNGSIQALCTRERPSSTLG